VSIIIDYGLWIFEDWRQEEYKLPQKQLIQSIMMIQTKPYLISLSSLVLVVKRLAHSLQTFISPSAETISFR
jgi:hypothetical protein